MSEYINVLQVLSNGPICVRHHDIIPVRLIAE